MDEVGLDSMDNEQTPSATPVNFNASTPVGNIRNFRAQPEVENFYRFLKENDLREEAIELLDRHLIANKSSQKS